MTSTLAALEQKLRDLEQELSSMDSLSEPRAEDAHQASPRAPVKEPRPAAYDWSAPEQPSTEPAAHVIDESLPETSGPPDASTEPAPASERSEPSSPAVDERPGAPARSPVEQATAISAELSSFRERLERFTRELASEYDELLARLRVHAPDLAVSAQQTALELEPAAQRPPASRRGQVEDSYYASVLDSPAPQADSYPAPWEREEAPDRGAGEESLEGGERAGAAEDETLFVGHVEIGVGPFFEVVHLGAFESDLARLPNVISTAVRRFEASHAVIDLDLAAPTALVKELKAIVAEPLRVRQIVGNRLALTFDES